MPHNRRVFLKPNAEFRDEFVDEFVEFPCGEFDDQVDATTQLLNYLASEPILREREERLTVVTASRFGASVPVQLYGSGARAIASVATHPRW